MMASHPTAMKTQPRLSACQSLPRQTVTQLQSTHRHTPRGTPNEHRLRPGNRPHLRAQARSMYSPGRCRIALPGLAMRRARTCPHNGDRSAGGPGNGRSRLYAWAIEVFLDGRNRLRDVRRGPGHELVSNTEGLPFQKKMWRTVARYRSGNTQPHAHERDSSFSGISCVWLVVHMTTSGAC